jgi:hypothetical protein
VLAALAGTSIWLGGQPASTSSGGEARHESPQAGVAPSTRTPEAAAPAVAADSSGGANVSGSPATVEGAAKAAFGSAAPAAPPAGIDRLVEPAVCVVAFGQDAMLTLPEGRVPQQVIVAPYGVRLVCG